MNKNDLIFKYFQKKDRLTVKNKQYQQTISSLFQWFIDNDKVNKDITTKHFPNFSDKAKIIAKQDGIMAGIEETKFLLKAFTSLSFKTLINDGSKFKNCGVIAEIKGKSYDILGYERTILNILQRMSGIATETHRLIELINQQPYLAATRKTCWGVLDKKAVACGGGLTHRLNLADGILIKDNHLEIIKKGNQLKDINEAIKHVLSLIIPTINHQLIEIEVKTEEQALTAVRTFRSNTSNNYLAILLDNFSVKQARQTVENLHYNSHLDQVILEASGGINETNISSFADTEVDIISIGSLTHSVKALDLTLEVI